jgi:hypothetical protein
MGDYFLYALSMVALLTGAFLAIALTPLFSKPPVPKNPKDESESPS